jgi:hypothetical protein
LLQILLVLMQAGQGLSQQYLSLPFLRQQSTCDHSFNQLSYQSIRQIMLPERNEHFLKHPY